MKKLLKIILWAIALVILIPIILILALPLWLGPVVKPSVNAMAPRFTKTDFRLEKLYLNPYTCNFELGGVRIGNPEGFSVSNALELGYMNIDVETKSLATDVIVVENIEVDHLYFSLVKNDAGEENLEIIKKNVLGAKEEAEKETEQEMTEQQKEAAKFNKKIIINRILFKDIRGQYGMLPIAVPTIELKDIGKDSGGYDPDHLGEALVKEFWASLLASSTDLGNLLGEGLKSLGNAGDAAKDAGKAVGEGAGKAVKEAGKQLENVGKSLKGLFGN